MPIRPENRSRYPADWKQISHRIRFVRADSRCECVGECGRGTHTGRCPNYHGLKAYGTGSLVVLTVAHLTPPRTAATKTCALSAKGATCITTASTTPKPCSAPKRRRWRRRWSRCSMSEIADQDPPLGWCPTWCELFPGHGWEDLWLNGPIRIHHWHRHIGAHQIAVEETEQMTPTGRVRQRQVVLDVESPTHLDIPTAFIAILADAIAIATLNVVDAGEVH